MSQVQKKLNLSLKKHDSIFINSIIAKRVIVPIVYINANIKTTLERIISSEIEGKCIIEGYVKRDSVRVLTYSSGLINSSNIVFETVIECLICNPVEGMTIMCNVKNVTKAGIRAETNDDISPVVIFVGRDHHYLNAQFSKIEEGDEIQVKVIGQRFELNDRYISIIAELVADLSELISEGGGLKVKKAKRQPKLIMEE